MLSHRLTAAPARLGVLPLEDRTVPAVFTCQVDPQLDPVGAVQELASNFNFANSQFYPGADEVRLFPGGVYVLGTGAGGDLPTIFPSSTQKTVDVNLTINGQGATITRIATDPDQQLLHFQGDANGYGRVLVRDLTLSGGKSTNLSGGAVYVDGVPSTFSNVRFVGNRSRFQGGAAFFTNSAAVAWENQFQSCQFVNNSAGGDGGAVATFTGADKISYRVTDCQFSGNSAAGNGGGLASGDNNLFVERCGFSGNTAGGSGGGLSAFVSVANQVLVSTSTLDGNTAGGSGGGAAVGGATTASAVVAYSTITRNTAGAGGGLSGVASAPLRVNQCVIAENTVGKSANDLGGTFTGDGGQNFVGTKGGFATATFTQNNVTSTFAFVTNGFGNPLLGPLQNNGGPTLTRSPVSGSRLIDTGRPTPAAYLPQLLVAPAVDQRGFARPIGFGGDIGAYEVQPFGTLSAVLSSGDNQVATTTGIYPTPLGVTIRDEYGQLVLDRPVLVRFPTTGSGPGATYPLGNQLIINPGATAASPGTGTGQVYAFANQAEGPVVLNALVDNAPPVRYRLYNRAPVGTVAVTAPAASAEVGTDYRTLSATVLDATGAPVAGAAVYFVVQLPTGGSGLNDPTAVPAKSPSGTFAGGDATVSRQLVQATTDASGVATATLTAGAKAGTFTVLVTAVAIDAIGQPTVLASDQVALTNRPGPAAAVLGAGQLDDTGADTSGSGQQVRILQPAAAPLVAVVTDRFGNPVAGVTVAFANLDPARAAGLANSGGTAVSDAQGRATFAAAANGKAETTPYTVRAATAGLTADFQLTNAPGLSAGVSVVSGNNQSAVVSDPRSPVSATNAFAAPLVVRVLDAGGNPVANALVTFSGLGARFSVTRVPTDANGVAAVTAATTDRAGTLAVTAATDTGAPGVFTLTAVPGAPAAVTVIAGDGQSVQAGSAYAPVVVRVVDQYQNPIAGAVPAVSAGGLAVSAPATDADGLSRLAVTAGQAAGSYPVTVQVGTQAATFTLLATGVPIDLENVPPVVGLSELTAVGLDAGLASRVSVYNRDGSLRTQFSPYDPGFLGGSRVATARGPLGVRVVVVPGPGRFPDAQVFSGDDGTPVAAFQPFEQTFVGGLYVSTGDLNRDGYEDYVFSADVGGGPRVKVVSGKTGATLQDFFGIEDVAFRGGARTAVGDVNGDGVPDLIVAAGVGGGPRIAVYDGTTVTGFRATPRRLVGDFFAFEQTLRNGAYVAAGDVTGDGVADLVLGGGPGGGPRVRVLNGAELVAGRQTVVSDFFAGPTTDRGGVKVSVKEVDGTASVTGGKGDIVTASGAGDGSRVTVYLGKDLRVGAPPAARGFDDLAGFRGGVFVG